MTRHHLAALSAAALLALGACSNGDDDTTAASPSTPKDPTTQATTPLTTGPPTIVEHVVDGDTLDLRDGTRVRLIGIDTPERGQPCYEEATAALADLVNGKAVDLTAGTSGSSVDRYGRLLRYVDVGTIDAGYSQIQAGYAIARYDSRDGYGRHEREDAYVAADAVTHPACEAAGGPPQTAQASAGGVFYGSCAEARSAGAAPLYTGEAGYSSSLDRDGDGVACEG